MCGIFGVLASPSTTMAQMRPFNSFIKDACIMSTTRGEDSTGMFQIRKAKNEMLSYKLPYNGLLYAKHARAMDMMTNVDISTITVGHNRAATRGSVNAENAHPFHHRSSDGKRNIIGVHNGSLYQHSSLEDGQRFDVDSDWIFYQIMKHGGIESIGKMNGAMALVWYEEDGKVRIYCNGKRPLHFAFAEDVDAMMIMSEAEMLWCLAKRNDIAIKDKIWYPGDDGKIFVFDPSDLTNYKTEAVKKPPVVVSAPSSTPYSNYYGNSTRGGYDYSKRTPTGSLIMEDAEGIKRLLDANKGDMVQFFLHEKLENKHDTALIGEVLFGLDDKAWCEYGIITGLTKDTRQNILDTLESDGVVMCKIVGYTNTDVNGSKYLCAVLSVPEAFIIKQRDSGEDDDPVEIPLAFHGPRGLVSEGMFKELTKDGCSACSCSLTAEDGKKDRIHWLAVDTGYQPVCGSCAPYYFGAIAE